jgi:hypothetical protein
LGGSKKQLQAGTARLITKSKGHIVNYELTAIVNLLAMSGNTYNSSGTWGTRGFDTSTPSTSYGYVKVGTGGGETGATTAGLTTANNTLPSSQVGNISNPSTGSYRINYLATWNSGTLATINVTEVGLLLCYFSINAAVDFTQLQPFGWAVSANTGGEAAAFFSRLSEADGDFRIYREPS